MFGWCAILFVLGACAFLDSLFNYGEIFRQVNSVLFLLVSLGLLVRTSMKVRLRYIESLETRLEELETLVGPSIPQPNDVFNPKKQTAF